MTSWTGKTRLKFKRFSRSLTILMTGLNSVVILLPAGIRQDMKFKLLRRRVAESMQLLVLLMEPKL